MANKLVNSDLHQTKNWPRVYPQTLPRTVKGTGFSRKAKMWYVYLSFNKKGSTDQLGWYSTKEEAEAKDKLVTL